MQIKANMAKGYRIRLAVISIALLGFFGWFMYDGLIGYPAEQERQLAFQDIQEEYGEEDWQKKWHEVADANGWSREQPGKPKSDWDIKAQFFYGVPCLIIGLPFLWGLIRSGGRWVAADEDGVSTSDGKHTTWDGIISIDTNKWKKKGIAYLHYNDDKGVEQRILLDDWKFEREPIVQIYEQAQSHVTGEPIDEQGEAPADAPQEESLEDSSV